MFNAICIKSLYFIHHYFTTDFLMFKVCASPIGWTTFIIVLAKLTSVCYSRRYANGKNKTTNRECTADGQENAFSHNYSFLYAR